MGGGGTNAFHIVGGYCKFPYATTTKTECWNGSAWSQEADTTTVTFMDGMVLTNDAYACWWGFKYCLGNSIDPSTEIYNGLSWAHLCSS